MSVWTWAGCVCATPCNVVTDKSNGSRGGVRRRLDGLEGWGGTTPDMRRARYAVVEMEWEI
eukprot:4791175-Amphidinium_carterae.1